MSMSVVCDLVRWEIFPRSVALSTLGGGGSMVCGTVDMVRRAMGSYWSLVDGTLGSDGAALGFWVTTLGSEAWSQTFDRHRIVHSNARRCLGFGGGGVTCTTFDKSHVGWAHRWMAWRRACIAGS